MIVLFGNFLVTTIAMATLFCIIFFGLVILWVLYIQNVCTDINQYFQNMFVVKGTGAD